VNPLLKQLLVSLLFLATAFAAGDEMSPGTRARRFLTDLIQIDTTNPPGNETRVAEYLKQVADRYGIPCELVGNDPARLNFVARLAGSGAEKPLLLMAHEDVVPADRKQWTSYPFSAEERDGYIYGRGADDTKNLLAAELSVLIELKQQGIALNRDIILLSEADEEAGSTGMQWLIANAYGKIGATAALNESGTILETDSGARLFEVQTAEKIPTRITLTAHGVAGHAALPRPDNAIVHLARAILAVTGEQPVRLNATTRRNLAGLARLPEYAWLAPLLPDLENPARQAQAAAQLRARDAELDAGLHTTVSPTMLSAGVKINVIPNTAEAQIDVRRLPDESRDEVLARLRKMVNDPAVDVELTGVQDMPATQPSSIESPVYRAMERVLAASGPRAIVVPFMSRGATDGAFLRAKGMDVYGVPLFPHERGDSRAHGNDERISVTDLINGTGLLMRIVMTVAAP
jgi:acetylornithine deacetylase/succinyl-diaminopimelate desuccinylase-like protein